jgi:potassium-dependent mechanosensitive channel
MVLKWLPGRAMVVLLIVVLGVSPFLVQAQPGPPASPEPGASPAQTLRQAFATGIGHLQADLKGWKSRLAATAAKLSQTKKESDDLQVAIASLKATMVLQRVPLFRVQEFMVEYADQEKELKKKLKDQDQEIEALKKDQQAQLETQNALRVQLGIMQTRQPQALSPQLQQSFLNYLILAGQRDRLAAQVLDQLEQRRRLLQQEHDLIVALAPQLKQLETAWKTELLQRPAAGEPVWEQAVRVWNSLTAIPERGWTWFTGLLASGWLGTFVWRHMASIFGLLGVIMLLWWSTRRLNDHVIRRFRTWRKRTDDLHLLPLYMMWQTLIANLFGLGLIFWLGLFFWTFNLISSDPVQLVLTALVTLWALRLTSQWVQGFFAGRAAGGVLALDQDVARFYRRSLKLFLAYLFLGLLGLKGAGLLDFPESSRLFLEHFFLVGILLWCWWLLRRPYLSRLLPELSDPTWLHHPMVGLVLRGLMLFLVAVIILAYLLGFQNLSRYLAQGAGWTLLALVLLWFLWLVGETIIRHLLHPQAGRASYRFPDKVELLQRLYIFSRWALSLVLGAAVLLGVLNFWGIKPQKVAWAFRWLTWGPAVGPVKLTTLSFVGVILAFYLGFFLSRLVRGLMMIRIFPRTDLDTGVQYTISTTVHYVILILAGLIALNILGFPLTNLVLVLGALGVGIGFGLQNIVNNFLSGLILLFERPIKVGDMLVIDGQWGLVKEIRVRSTIFETFDRYVLIIPNSELVSGKVLNWTHYGAGINRLTLKVGVSYGSDVRQVTQLITEVCRANPRVVPEPPPQIFFSAYGDSSLDFTIWVHLRTPSDRIPATHELNGAIFETFNQHGIEIPFPQRDLYIKQWSEGLEKKGEPRSLT